MTYKEIQIVSWVCVTFGWAFLLAKQPEIALGFLLAALGGFIWGWIRKRLNKYDRL